MLRDKLSCTNNLHLCAWIALLVTPARLPFFTAELKSFRHRNVHKVKIKIRNPFEILGMMRFVCFRYGVRALKA